MRIYYLLIAVILLSLPILFLWLGNDRQQEFTQTHQKIAENSTNQISNAISRFIEERRRLVSAFATYNHRDIKKLVQDPTNDSLVDKLSEDFGEIFPNFIAFTIADTKGNVLIDDFDGHIGELCKEDIISFSQTDRQLPRVHPNTENYHFDIMVNVNEQKNILFASFNADMLGSIIQTADVLGHNFILTYQLDKKEEKQSDKKVLIEITKNGSRQHITDRKNYLLTNEELNRILFQRDVADTSWQVTDLHSAQLFSDYKSKILLNLGTIYGIFLTIIILLTLLMRREEQRKMHAEQLRSEFIGIVSHELRTPLTSIKGSLGLVANEVTGKLPDKALSMVEIAYSNCERLIELVNDLLDIQKIESGKISLEKKDINLSSIVKQAITDIEAYGSKFSVTFQLTDLLPNTIIYADEGRMLQVMNNLLSNAAKYGKDHDVVDISIIPYNGKVRLGITDNGNGISIELQNNVFEKFSQDKNNKSEKIKSTGLGLHIVKQIVNLHNGKIDFYTSKKGTTFYIDLPIKKPTNIT